MLSYVIVGSGYRAQYFARVAQTYPRLFRALFLCRSEEKALRMRRETGVDAVLTAAEAEAFQPDFIVVAVDRGHVADVTAEWAQRGYPVVAETPAGASMAQLERLWRLHLETGARIVCCEQYHRHPVLAAGFEAVARGDIGEPQSAYLSLVHDYHAASLIRRLLRVEGERYTLRAVRQTSMARATDSRYGAILDGSAVEEERTLAHIAFESGKTAVYDFAPLQYRSYIRARHLTVRGSAGEWSDRVIMGLDGDNQPKRTFLMDELPAAYRCLDTQALRDARKTWQPELFLDTLHDEYAIATILMDMARYIAGGPSPYSLPEALDDAYFWLLVERAAQSPWTAIESERVPWRE